MPRPKLTASDLALLREGADGNRIKATVERRGVPDPEGQARQKRLTAFCDADLARLWHVRGKGDPNGDYVFSYILTDAGKRAIA